VSAATCKCVVGPVREQPHFVLAAKKDCNGEAAAPEAGRPFAATHMSTHMRLT